MGKLRNWEIGKLQIKILKNWWDAKFAKNEIWKIVWKGEKLEIMEKVI